MSCPPHYRRTCFGDYVKFICAEYRDVFEEFKKAHHEKKGAHLVFAVLYRMKNPAEWESFQAEWNEGTSTTEGRLISCGDPC